MTLAEQWIEDDKKSFQSIEKQDEYAIIDELIGICETGCFDVSFHHDAIIYRKPEVENI